MELNTDWSDLLSLFASADVEFMVVGAFALSYYGEPRMTGDIDLWIRPTTENAQRVLKSLEAFGFGAVGITLADLTSQDQVIQLGFPPRRIDLLTSLSGLDFEECWPRRQVGTLGGLSLPFIGKKDFIRNKAAVGRPKDLADIEALAD